MQQVTNLNENTTTLINKNLFDQPVVLITQTKNYITKRFPTELQNIYMTLNQI